jgi:uncharacterized membrane protein
MSPKEKAISLVNRYRIILMNEDTECGNEILCTGIAKRCALIAVDEILDVDYFDMSEEHFENIMEYWEQVKHEIEKL